jgi:uncharacterized membrane protein YcfT
MSASCIWNPSSSHSARCGSFICCRCSSSSQNCHAASPPWRSGSSPRRWTVIDEFCARFVYFYSGYLFASYVFALSDRSRARPALALIGLALWALVNGGLVMSGVSHWPLISLALGFAGAGAIIVMGTLLARMQWLNFLRYCGEHSIVIYLAFFLPMAVTRTLLLKTGVITDIGTISLIVTVAGVAGAVVIWRLALALRADFLFERPAAFWIAPKKAAPALQPAE